MSHPLRPVPAPTRDEATHHHPNARRPERLHHLETNGVRLALWEWGDPAAEPVVFTHGGFDFAGTFDLLAPIVADAGFRVVAWDQRGHGDSSQRHLYSWEADLRDINSVLDHVSSEPVAVVGHSKGGALTLQLAEAMPHRVKTLVNLDGLPSSRSWPDVPDRHRSRMVSGELTAWLDHRRAAATKVRKPGTIEELAERRGRMNPRLPPAWLRYQVTIGAFEASDGWRWKFDPAMRLGGFGPWRPEWSMARLPALSMPVLCVLGLDVEVMGWGTLPEDVIPNLPRLGRFEGLEGVGHFVHVERPDLVSDLILDHLS